MNIAITDDIPFDAAALRTLLKDYAERNHQDLQISVFSSAEELLNSHTSFAVIFLDIYMDEMSGIEAAERIRRHDSDVLLIFLTSSRNHMPEAFHVHAFEYIQKPIDPVSLKRVMDDALQKLDRNTAAPRLNFSIHRREYKLPYTNIKSVVSTANYLEITDRDNNVYKPRMTFSTVSELLSGDERFLTILRGILVNMDYVIGFEEKVCLLEGGITLPINTRNQRKIEQIWLDYSFDRIRKDSGFGRPH